MKRNKTIPLDETSLQSLTNAELAMYLDKSIKNVNDIIFNTIVNGKDFDLLMFELTHLNRLRRYFNHRFPTPKVKS